MWRSLVAHLHGVQGVASSNLVIPTKEVHCLDFFVGRMVVVWYYFFARGGILKWLKRLAWKAGRSGNRCEGSNPFPSAIDGASSELRLRLFYFIKKGANMLLRRDRFHQIWLPNSRNNTQGWVLLLLLAWVGWMVDTVSHEHKCVC